MPHREVTPKTAPGAGEKSLVALAVEIVLAASTCSTHDRTMPSILVINQHGIADKARGACIPNPRAIYSDQFRAALLAEYETGRAKSLRLSFCDGALQIPDQSLKKNQQLLTSADTKQITKNGMAYFVGFQETTIQCSNLTKRLIDRTFDSVS